MEEDISYGGLEKEMELVLRVMVKEDLCEKC